MLLNVCQTRSALPAPDILTHMYVLTHTHTQLPCVFVQHLLLVCYPFSLYPIALLFALIRFPPAVILLSVHMNASAHIFLVNLTLPDHDSAVVWISVCVCVYTCTHHNCASVVWSAL